MDSAPQVVAIDPNDVRLMQAIVRRRSPRGLFADLMQEGMLWLLENGARLKDIGVTDRRAYVAVSIYHLVNRNVIREKRDGGHATIDLDRMAATKGDSDPSSSDGVEFRLLVAAVRDRLPRRESRVFECIVARHWSVRQTARELGLQPAQVRRSRRRIQQLLPRLVAKVLGGSRNGEVNGRGLYPCNAL
jgi:RNA polymerase sigma factor (sigma-70 family)